MSTIQPSRACIRRKQDNRDTETGLAKVEADGKTFLKTGSVTGLSDWPLSDGRVWEHVRYGCPEDVFEHDYDRLVQALTIVAGDGRRPPTRSKRPSFALYATGAIWAPTIIQPLGYDEWL